MLYAETIGTLLAMLTCTALGGLLAKVLILRYWDESSKGNVVDTTDALIALFSIVFSWIQLLKSNWVATVCTVAVYLSLTAMSQISVYASLGYSSMVFAIVGFLSPALLCRDVPSASARDSSPGKSSDNS
jgi:hypothetical protein